MAGWRVDYLRPLLRPQIAAWLDGAVDGADLAERSKRIKAAFAELARRLVIDPLAAGDPRNTMKKASVVRCIAIVDGFAFTYGVHGESKTVWIASVAPPRI